RAEALQDEPLDQAIEHGPEREHPQDARDRRAPPLAGGNGHPEAADDRHARDPHTEPVEEARLARNLREDCAVTTCEPRPPCADAATRRRSVDRLPAIGRRGSHADKGRRACGLGTWSYGAVLGVLMPDRRASRADSADALDPGATVDLDLRIGRARTAHPRGLPREQPPRRCGCATE